jgi:hypothetical protein
MRNICLLLKLITYSNKGGNIKFRSTRIKTFFYSQKLIILIWKGGLHVVLWIVDKINIFYRFCRAVKRGFFLSFWVDKINKKLLKTVFNKVFRVKEDAARRNGEICKLWERNFGVIVGKLAGYYG